MSVDRTAAMVALEEAGAKAREVLARQRVSRKPRKSATGAGGQCENCERPTEVLFSGFKFENVPPQVVREMSYDTLVRMKAFSQAFSVQSAEVCMRCRPLSNQELQELLQQ